MYGLKRVSEVYETAGRIPFDDSARIIIMSDCHRGDGSWADDFSRNQNIYFAALNHYYSEGYTYIELGDGDELWENKNFSDIAQVHGDAFWILSQFIKRGRFYSLFGNHDIVKKGNGFFNNTIIKCNSRRKSYLRQAGCTMFYEGLVLQHKINGCEILLIHGHQVDFFNDRLAWLSGFLVRFFWRPLELFGANDPTSAAKNYKKKVAVEKKLIEWIRQNDKILVAGHTHRPMFSEAGKPLYFNSGSCVHPNCITGLEISNGCISLVKWCVKAKPDGTLYVGKDELAGPSCLEGLCYK